MSPYCAVFGYKPSLKLSDLDLPGSQQPHWECSQSRLLFPAVPRWVFWPGSKFYWPKYCPGLWNPCLLHSLKKLYPCPCVSSGQWFPNASMFCLSTRILKYWTPLWFGCEFNTGPCVAYLASGWWCHLVMWRKLQEVEPPGRRSIPRQKEGIWRLYWSPATSSLPVYLSIQRFCIHFYAAVLPRGVGPGNCGLNLWSH